MITAATSVPGSATKPNEDWYGIADLSRLGPVVVLDGGTARTETGCVHGVAWYSRQLGTELLALMQTNPSEPLTATLAAGIAAVAELHRGSCDLSHPGTPSAAVGMIRPIRDNTWEYAVLGDITVVFDRPGERLVVADNRISESAKMERVEADQWPIGSPQKDSAMIAMKHVELAARNREYWIAASDPIAAEHAVTGTAHSVARVAMLTDGAARAESFGLIDWSDLLDTIDRDGPERLIELVRAAEDSDPQGRKWPRNKKSDDATVVYVGNIVESSACDELSPNARAVLRDHILG
jgi:hypothetical protein